MKQHDAAEASQKISIIKWLRSQVDKDSVKGFRLKTAVDWSRLLDVSASLIRNVSANITQLSPNLAGRISYVTGIDSGWVLENSTLLPDTPAPIPTEHILDNLRKYCAEAMLVGDTEDSHGAVLVFFDPIEGARTALPLRKVSRIIDCKTGGSYVACVDGTRYQTSETFDSIIQRL